MLYRCNLVVINSSNVWFCGELSGIDHSGTFWKFLRRSLPHWGDRIKCRILDPLNWWIKYSWVLTLHSRNSQTFLWDQGSPQGLIYFFEGPYLFTPSNVSVDTFKMHVLLGLCTFKTLYGNLHSTENCGILNVAVTCSATLVPLVGKKGKD